MGPLQLNIIVSPSVTNADGRLGWPNGIVQSITISDGALTAATNPPGWGDGGNCCCWGGGRTLGIGTGATFGQEKLAQPADELRTSVTLIKGVRARASLEKGFPADSTTPTTEARNPFVTEPSSPVQARQNPGRPLRAAKAKIFSSPFASNCAATEYKPPGRSGSPRMVNPD